MLPIMTKLILLQLPLCFLSSEEIRLQRRAKPVSLVLFIFPLLSCFFPFLIMKVGFLPAKGL